MTIEDDCPTSHSRRTVLTGGLAAGAALLAGCTPKESMAASTTPAANSPSSNTGVVLTPQTTEGPYYFDAKQVRADITEGFPGIPLDVEFHVVDQAGAPLAQARVDIWHCNAAGVYSGYAGQGDDRQVSTEGQTFLRGTQSTDAAGRVTFHSIYPGWYRGRTTHIHFKVILGETHALTSQFTLPDALNEFLYTELDAYKRESLRDTLNSNDGIALQAGDRLHGSVRENADRYLVTLAVAVDREAKPVIDRPSAPGQGKPGPPPGMQGPPGAAGSGGGPMQPASLTGAERISALVPKK